MRMPKFVRGNSGQALVETILILPLLLIIILNAVNFAYFFLMALNITSASRSSAIYSVMGSSTPAAAALPNAGPVGTTTTVSYLAIQDLTGAVYSPSTGGTGNTGIHVCSPTVGILNAGTTTQKSDCTTIGSIGSFSAADPDPEMNEGNTVPAFLLNRVDIAYQFRTPIPIFPFNAIVLISSACNSGGTCTFYRHSVMRVM
ncbi:MAG: TadE/TadG family type IV pilus assembly protein [Terriglobales bacterium]